MSRFKSVRPPAWSARLRPGPAASFPDLVRAHLQQIRAGVSVVAIASMLGSLAAAAAAASTAPRLLETQRLTLLARRIGADLSEPSLRRFAAAMDPAARRIAARYDPSADRPEPAPPWAQADGGFEAPPDNDLQRVPASQAMLLNAQLPFSLLPNAPARPFATPAAGAGGQALTCLTAAVYYEAASEGEEGQAAVAQVVLNRVRHPMFPRTVCGVVFQGSQRAGCQFTFTCDGSLGRRPDAAGWARAERVAARALGGYVMTAVGEATHYHTEWVFPAWSPQMVKLTKVGAHIFYRWNGAAGLPSAFTGAYAGEAAEVWPGAGAKLIKVGLVQPAPETPAQQVEMATAQPAAIVPLQVAPRPEAAAVTLDAAAAPRTLSVQAPAFSVIARESPRPQPRIAVPSNW